MVVIPQEITAHSAIRPRIVMLWVFFLVTVVVVGPTVPASAFVSCTWHHSQIPGELPESVSDSVATDNASTIRDTRKQRLDGSITGRDISACGITADIPLSPATRFLAEITLRGPPASL